MTDVDRASLHAAVETAALRLVAAVESPSDVRQPLVAIEVSRYRHIIEACQLAFRALRDLHMPAAFWVPSDTLWAVLKVEFSGEDAPRRLQPGEAEVVVIAAGLEERTRSSFLPKVDAAGLLLIGNPFELVPRHRARELPVAVEAINSWRSSEERCSAVETPVLHGLHDDLVVVSHQYRSAERRWRNAREHDVGNVAEAKTEMIRLGEAKKQAGTLAEKETAFVRSIDVIECLAWADAVWMALGPTTEPVLVVTADSHVDVTTALLRCESGEDILPADQLDPYRQLNTAAVVLVAGYSFPLPAVADDWRRAIIVEPDATPGDIPLRWVSAGSEHQFLSFAPVESPVRQSEELTHSLAMVLSSIEARPDHLAPSRLGADSRKHGRPPKRSELLTRLGPAPKQLGLFAAEDERVHYGRPGGLLQKLTEAILTSGRAAARSLLDALATFRAVQEVAGAPSDMWLDGPLARHVRALAIRAAEALARSRKREPWSQLCLLSSELGWWLPWEDTGTQTRGKAAQLVQELPLSLRVDGHRLGSKTSKTEAILALDYEADWLNRDEKAAVELEGPAELIEMLRCLAPLGVLRLVCAALFDHWVDEGRSILLPFAMGRRFNETVADTVSALQKELSIWAPQVCVVCGVDDPAWVWRDRYAPEALGTSIGFTQPAAWIFTPAVTELVADALRAVRAYGSAHVQMQNTLAIADVAGHLAHDFANFFDVSKKLSKLVRRGRSVTPAYLDHYEATLLNLQLLSLSVNFAFGEGKEVPWPPPSDCPRDRLHEASSFDLSRALNEAVELFVAAYHKRPECFAVSVPPDPINVFSHRPSLMRCVDRILANAVNTADRPASIVRVVARRSEEGVGIEFWDDSPRRFSSNQIEAINNGRVIPVLREDRQRGHTGRGTLFLQRFCELHQSRRPLGLPAYRVSPEDRKTQYLEFPVFPGGSE